MVSITSNIDQFLKDFRRVTYGYNSVIRLIAIKVAQRMCEDMALEISQLKYIWEEDGGGMSDLPQIDFDIKSESEGSIVVSIGENLPKLEMKDGNTVNPAYFIEFGFGIVGQNSPKHNRSKYDWKYNIHGHEHEWYFRGKYNELLKSSGREGINFMYNVIQKYKKGWKDVFESLIEERNL